MNRGKGLLLELKLRNLPHKTCLFKSRQTAILYSHLKIWLLIRARRDLKIKDKKAIC